MKARLATVLLLSLVVPGWVPAAVNSFRSASAAEPSRLAHFPVDGDTAPAVVNAVAPAFSGTLQAGATISTAAERSVGTQSTAQNGSGRIQLTGDPAWNFPDGSGTVEAFLYQTSAVGYSPCFLALRQDGGAGVRYSLHGDTNGNNLHFWNGATVSSWPVSPTMINRLCHVAVVFRSGTVTAYLNGVSLGARSNALGSADSAPAQIGASSPNGDEAWRGNIDEVTLYSDALPASAVSAHYQAWLSDDSGAPPRIVNQPASVTTAGRQEVSFSIVLGAPDGVSYRWQRNGEDIIGANSATYSLSPVGPADHDARFRCIVYNSFGGTYSESATLTVNDPTPPVLLGAASPYSPRVVILTFSEPVDLSRAVFTIAGGNVVAASAGPGPDQVLLTVGGLAAGSSYVVTATNVKDAAGNILTNGSASFTAAPPPVPAPITLIRPGREPLGPATRRGGLVISEINYHPADRTDAANLEFVEICNTLPWTEDLGGFRLTGEISYRFPPGTSIAAGGYLVVAADPVALQTIHGLTGVLGPYTGALNNSGGTLRLRNDADALVFEVEYDSGHPWQPAADGAGHTLVLARASYGMNDPMAWDMSFQPGGSPGSADPQPEDPYRTVMINEIWATAAGGDFIELYNYSTAAVDVSGCTLSDDRNAAKYVLPVGSSLPPGGFLAVFQAKSGFGLKAGGDTVYFRAPGLGGASGRVLDCLRFGPQQPGTTYGRYPDGAAAFSVLRDDTPDSTNEGPPDPAAVISEISYHPPAGSSQAPFIEIANLSGAPLPLGGWRLRGGIRYDFPTGTTLATGAQLAVTNFSGSLNRTTGERLRLERPIANNEGGGVETIYPVMDEVTYGTGGRWGRDSDGGGSTLEKRELYADGRPASNWSDSSGASRAEWITLSNTGVLDNGQPGTPANRLEVMLLGEGEVLIDNVEFVQGAGANLVGNPGFENGQTSWRADGTHAGSTVEAGTGVGGTAAMHLRATGRGDLAGNRLINTLTSAAATGGVARTLRAQVKYVRGHPEILFRVHGGWLETTGNVLGSVIAGTPGAVNSRNVANAGPAVSSVTHLPVLPTAGQPVVVYARIQDLQGLASAVLNYRIDPATTTTAVIMQLRGAGLYSAEIPGQPGGKLTAFNISSSDAAGAITNFPDKAPASECLIRWGETQPAGNQLPSYRLWYTQATGTKWTTRLKNSNAPLEATFVCGDYRVIHQAGAMFSGSPFHTPGFTGPTGAACDYTISVPSDERYLGETDMVWSGPGTFGSDSSQIREQAAWWIARRTGVPALHRRFVNVILNGTRRGTIMEDTQQPNSDFLKEHFPEDSGGPLFKAQDWIEYNDDGAGFQQLSRAVLARALSGGQHKTATYRYRWAIRSSESALAYSPFHTLIDAFNTGPNATDPAFRNALDPILDQDSWSRALAMQRIVGNWDTWGWSYGKNMYAYKPDNGPWAMIPWDMDFGFGPDGSSNPAPDTATAGLFQNTSNYDGSAPGDPLATKFRTQPAFRRAYWCALLDAANGPMVPATINARIDLMTAGLAKNGVTANASQVSQVKTYIAARRNYIITQANAVYGTTTFSLTGNDTLTDEDGLVTLAGTAPPTVKSLRINGVVYTPQWNTEKAWTLPLTLYTVENKLTVEGLDLHGNATGNFPVNITVTGPPPLPQVKINEWMASNSGASGIVDPSDGKSDDWFELYNAGQTPVDLGGFFLTDRAADPAQFRIPQGTVISPGGYLLVWCDGTPEQNGITAGQLDTNFRLNASGDFIGLYTPDGTAVDTRQFGPQAENISQGRYPDSTDAIRTLVPTPRRRNVLPPEILSFTQAGADVWKLVCTTEPTYSYQLEFSPGLTGWAPWGAPVPATGFTQEFLLPATGIRTYWRVRLVFP